MSRFADPEDRAEVVIGPCQCDGTPHAQDTAIVRRKVGNAALGRIGKAAALDPYDKSVVRRQILAECVVSWNLLGPDGKAWPPTPYTIAELDTETLDRLAELINEGWEQAKLPNDSAGGSANGSPETGSQAPTTKAPASSTTSS